MKTTYPYPVLIIITFFVLSFSNLYSQWHKCTGTSGIFFYSFCTKENSIIAGGSNGVNISNDNGNNWEPHTMDSHSANTLAVKGNNIFAGTQPHGIYLSTNSGLSWSQTPITNGYVYSIVVNGNHIIAGTNNDMNGGISISSNNGTNWYAGSWLSTFVMCLAVGNKIYAGTSYEGIFYSTNNGSNWTQSYLNNIYVLSLACSGTTVYAGTLDSGVYKSTNDGTNWSHTSLNNQRVHSLSIYGNYLFAGTFDSGFYVSSNNGVNWTTKNDGLEQSTIIRCIQIFNNNIFIGTDLKGIWKRPISELITEEQNISNLVPTNYILQQNYPNPFNPSTNIRYSVKKSEFRNQYSEVKLVVYNSLGKEIETIVNKRHEPGIYEVSFSGSNLASGIYFYSMYADGIRIDTKRMVLIK